MFEKKLVGLGGLGESGLQLLVALLKTLHLQALALPRGLGRATVA